MQINLEKTNERSNSSQSETGGVVMAAHLQRTRVFIDSNGNEIDPVTKKIIKRKGADEDNVRG